LGFENTKQQEVAKNQGKSFLFSSGALEAPSAKTEIGVDGESSSRRRVEGSLIMCVILFPPWAEMKIQGQGEVEAADGMDAASTSSTAKGPEEDF